MVSNIEKLSKTNLICAGRCYAPFTVNSRLVLTASDGIITYTIAPVTPYQKIYPVEAVDYPAYLDRSDRAIFLAMANGEPAGEIRLSVWWNGLAYIEDLAVAPPYRRLGVGRALITQVVAWARAAGLPGLMLETQDINVPACCLYAACGFELAGFDRRLYAAIAREKDEIALYWYLLF